MNDILKLVRKVDLDIFHHRKNIYPIFLFIQFVLVCISSIYNTYLAMVLSLATVPLTHAYVKISLKIVSGKEDTISFKDTFEGVRNFRKLFPAYIIRKIIINIVTFLCIAPVLTGQASRAIFFEDLFSWIRFIILNDTDAIYNLNFLQQIIISPITVLSILLAILITVLLTLSFSMVPYLIEEEDLSWAEAIKKSFFMTKRHIRKLFTIRLFYLFRIALVHVLILLATTFLKFNSIFSYIIWFILSLYLPIILYLPYYELSLGYCYKEMKEKDSL